MTPMDQALARLDHTRAQLRQELLPPPEADAAPNGQSPGIAWPRRLRAAWRHWRRRLQRWPLAGSLLTAVQDSWLQHPWRPAAELLAQEARAVALPAVRRHPVAAVAIAAGLGMALVASRAWHVPLLAVSLRSTPRRLGRWLLRQFAQPPVQAGVLSLLLMLSQRGQASAAGTETAADTAPTAPQTPP